MRVNTAGQDAQLQLDASLSAGVKKRDVLADVTSGSKSAKQRPVMKRILDYAEDGATVVVWRIDRLGRSLLGVLATVNHLRDRRVKPESTDGTDAMPTSE